MEGNTGVEPIASLAEATEDRRESPCHVFHLQKKSLLENVESEGVMAGQ